MKNPTGLASVALLLLLFSFSAAGVRPDTELQYRYSTLIVADSTARDVFLTVNNTGSSVRSFNTSVSGIAEFPNGRHYRIHTLDPMQQRRFRVTVESGTPGDYVLRAKTMDTETYLNSTDTLPVHVRKSSAATLSREVPGMGAIQLVFVILASTVLYSSLL